MNIVGQPTWYPHDTMNVVERVYVWVLWLTIMSSVINVVSHAETGDEWNKEAIAEQQLTFVVESEGGCKGVLLTTHKAIQDHKSYDPNMISGVSRVDIIVLKHTLVSIFRGRLIEDAGNVKVGRDLHNATISLSFSVGVSSCLPSPPPPPPLIICHAYADTFVDGSRRPVRGALKLRRGSTRSTTIIKCWSSKVDISSFFATIIPNTNTNPALNFEAS
ncbi:hypothetical protein LguiB_018482 [Lonicera macranthoides]